MDNEKKELQLTQNQQQAVQDFTDDIVEKTLATGHEINPANQVDGAVLRRESLADVISTLTWTEEDLQFYRDIAKIPSNNTVEQYAIQTSKGRVGHSRFVREPEIASKNHTALEKKRVNMKFISDTRQVTIAAQVVDSLTSPIEMERDSAITVVAKTIEWASFYGDADLSDQGGQDNGVEFDGLAKLIARQNVIDARGESLSETLLNQAAVLVAKGYGTATDAYMPIGVHSDFVNNYLNRQTQLMRDNNGQVTTGFGIDAFRSARGLIKLHGSTVMELDNILDQAYRPAPHAPRPATVTANVQTGANGKFREEDLKAHSYKVVVHGDESESAPSEAVTATVANATDGVELTIAVDSMYGQRAQFVSIYRQGDVTNEYYLIARVGLNQANAEGNIVFTDVNETIPETADVFVGEMTPSVMHLFEMLPMLQLPLAQMSASVTFSVLWYGSLALKAPRKWVRVRNVRYIPVADPHNGAGFVK